MERIRAMFDPLLDRLDDTITNDTVMGIIVCVGIGIGVCGYIACHFLPTHHDRSH